MRTDDQIPSLRFKTALIKRVFGFLLIFSASKVLLFDTLYGMENRSTRPELSLATGTEFRVTSPVQIAETMQHAKPGDILVMANGTWKNVQIIFEGNGTEEMPITLRAETPGKVFLTGKSNLRIAGSYLVVDGLVFMDGYSPSGAVVEFRNGAGNEASHCRLTNSAIIGFNPPDRLQDYKWVSLYGTRNRLDHCYIKGKDHAGTTVVVWLSDQPNYHLIDNNYFGHRPALGQNGGETIRIGTSDWSLHDSYSVVEYNYFERCNGEVEIISSKSCENIYRYNTFVECEGALTLRHGNRCLVEGNFFFGNQKNNTGGIRIIGEDHVVINNYLEGLRGTSSRSALSMVNGVPDSPLSYYFQVKRAVVAYNTFYNNRRNFDIGIFADSEVCLPPEDCTIANNVVYSTSTDRPLIIETDKPVNMKYEGNIFYGTALGIEVASGISLLDPMLQKAEDGLWRPAEASPVIGAAVGEYPYVTDDMDGQIREANSKDVGADQKSDSPVLRRPLPAADAGPLWFTSEELIVPGEQVYPPLSTEPYRSDQPKVNQLGYLPGSFKQFTILADSVTGGQEFIILNEHNEVLFSGNIENTPVNDTDISGEEVYRGDFSSFATTGVFRVKVGNKTSFPFEIHQQVYDTALYHMLRFFYLVRANVAIDDPVTGLSHSESHTRDASLDDGSGNSLDLSGGWYTSGSFGKWVLTTAFTCAHLMNLYMVNPDYFGQMDLKVPESGGDLPGMLRLAKTGLDWLLKMQREDGAVFHKVYSELDAYGLGPDEDMSQRRTGDTGTFSTNDAAVFTAVTAQASRFFAPFDSAFSETCKTAALKSWDWVKSNPGTGQEVPPYTDPLTWQEEMWAKAEVYMLTGNQSTLSSFYNDLRSRTISEPAWYSPQMFGCIHLYNHPGLPGVVQSWIEQIIMNYAGDLKKQVDLSGYGSAADKYSWQKGSNAVMSNYGAVFIYAFMISGNDDWLDYASQQLDYLFGRNSLDYSFVTGFGTRKCEQPYHWITKRYGIVPKGLLVQGAVDPVLISSSPEFDDISKELKNDGFPMAKTYADTIDSWTLNEADIYSVSSFAFLTGYLSVHNRKMNTFAEGVLLNGNDASLTLFQRDGYLYCKNCSGNIQVYLYNIYGQLLYRNLRTPSADGQPLLELSTFLSNDAILLYKVVDEAGKTGNGKIGLF